MTTTTATTEWTPTTTTTTAAPRIDQLPKQGTAAPWRVYQNYLRDVYLLRRGPVEDAGVRFGRGPVPAAPPPITDQST